MARPKTVPVDQPRQGGSKPVSDEARRLYLELLRETSGKTGGNR
jgi:hypothetical protein